ncbi:MAG: hypothetical protein KY462_08960 [Actinobacteria bacterium]|nr:hypothetical protein [Actinomycetota bacterium]
MRAMTDAAVVVCDHQLGVVRNRPSQRWVTVEGRPLLVATDPEDRTIVGCPNLNPLTGQKPCMTTLRVQTGYSALVRIDGHPVCLDTVKGLTDGAPPGTFHYSVRTPGQTLLNADA